MSIHSMRLSRCEQRHAYVYDAKGIEYLDFYGGHAVIYP